VTLYLPIANIALSLGAAVIYAVSQDWRHALYWACAGLIAVSVIV
jgi:hypothetical protein